MTIIFGLVSFLKAAAFEVVGESDLLAAHFHHAQNAAAPAVLQRHHVIDVQTHELFCGRVRAEPYRVEVRLIGVEAAYDDRIAAPVWQAV